MVPVGKVNSGFLDWFVECGHFAFQSIHEFQETCSTSVMVCENQFSCTGMGNVVCVQQESVPALFIERIAHICEKPGTLYLLSHGKPVVLLVYVRDGPYASITVSLASEAISY